MNKNWQNPIYWTIAALVIALLPQFASMPVHLIPIMLVPVVWRILAEVKGWKPMHFAFRIGLTVLTSYALVETYGTLVGRRAAISLLALMLSLKLLETFKVRDARIVASLALFLCTTQFLFSQGMGMLVYAAGCLISSIIALTLLQRDDSFKTANKVVPGGINVLTELKFSTRLMIISLPIALALFMFFPRWSSPMWGVPENTLDSKSGLSDSMTPGSIQSLFMDDSPAFRATFEGAIPPRSQLYWRGPVFVKFDGETWEPSEYYSNAPAEKLADPEGAPWTYSVQMEPNERHSFFALDYPTNIPKGTSLTFDYQLKTHRPVTQLTSYTVTSNPAFINDPEDGQTFRTESLQVSQESNTATLDMMRRWAAETPDPRVISQRAISYFNTEEFFYTLNPPMLSTNSVDEFLFNTRRGFCEHYASAFAVMMRFAGIPARIVTGYQGGYYNELGNYILVRQSDAHAWVEIWLEGAGWTRVDPTAAVAPSRIEQNALEALGGRRHAFDFEWVRNMRNGFDMLERVWNDWVIRFDAGLQANLLKPFGIGQISSRGLVLLLALVCIVLTLIVIPAVLRMRNGKRKDRTTRAWQKFYRRLKAAGVPVSQSMGPHEVRDLASSHLIEKAPQIVNITELYTRLRYAADKPDEGKFRAAARKFRA